MPRDRTVEPPSASEPVAAVETPDDAVAAIWGELASCESGGDWSSTVGRYDGGLQFDPRTWTGHGGSEFAPTADRATPSEQVAVAERVLAAQGWSAWPVCARRLGLR